MTSMRDVAKHAGVSVMTVSNVVNNRPGVSQETRLLVEESIRQLLYRPNLSARSLARGRTGVLSLCIPEVEIPYFAEISSSMMRAAERHSCRIMINQTGWDRDRELEVLRGRGSDLTDGVLLYPATLTHDDLDHVASTVPIVLFGGSEVFANAAHVVIDNAAAAEQATRHLLELGHRKIAVLGPHLDPQSRKPNRRLLGYARALRRSKITYRPELVVDAPEYHRADGYRAMTHLLQLDEPPTAVFCLSDLQAVGARFCLAERGLRVPEDVSLVGFDDIEEAAYLLPPLTTVRPDRAAIAEQSLRLLVERLDGERRPEAVTAGHELVVRHSTGRPPQVD
ncbi:LacI family DNA-binding transcriptional regulator [Microlunatus soli]|uniref:DNA-binding transcriptional regulator, LacI/PurR family n=1 Tax=Microlunatus soli TaxID=630515 RepID=A0A1H1ZD14_9ACTN|nr:LacI family DNA-binding transcriptional regulator [Microlunatus soli]SDT31560.1 DNA-binding transcriptional regulator, LacI/PurR family [Microlunatus soli]